MPKPPEMPPPPSLLQDVDNQEAVKVPPSPPKVQEKKEVKIPEISLPKPSLPSIKPPKIAAPKVTIPKIAAPKVTTPTPPVKETKAEETDNFVFSETSLQSFVAGVRKTDKVETTSRDTEDESSYETRIVYTY